MNIRILSTLNLLVCGMLPAMIQEAPEKRPASYFDLIPDVTKACLHEWQSYSIPFDAAIPANRPDLRVRECIKTDNPYFGPIVYLLYRDKPQAILPLLNSYLTLAVVAGPLGAINALDCMLKMKGIDPNVMNINYRYAIKESTPGVMNCYVYIKNTPLVLASGNNKAGCVELLLKAKADVNKISDSESSPLRSAIINNATDAARILLKEPTIRLNHQEYLHTALDYQAYEIAQLLLEKDTSLIHEQNKYGQTAFIKAIESAADEDMASVQPFLPIIEKIDINQQCFNGATPLHEACARGNSKMVQWLLTLKNIEVNSDDDRGRTPLHVAVWNDHAAIVQLLVDYPHINLLKKTDNGNTACDIAQSPEVTEILQEALRKKCSGTA